MTSRGKEVPCIHIHHTPAPVTPALRKFPQCLWSRQDLSHHVSPSQRVDIGSKLDQKDPSWDLNPHLEGKKVEIKVEMTKWWCPDKAVQLSCFPHTWNCPGSWVLSLPYSYPFTVSPFHVCQPRSGSAACINQLLKTLMTYLNKSPFHTCAGTPEEFGPGNHWHRFSGYKPTLAMVTESCQGTTAIWNYFCDVDLMSR